MPQASGSFSGRTNSQAMMAVKDQPGHEVGIIEVSGLQRSSDPLWNDATVSYWGLTDLVGGAGTQTGYFMNTHTNGDIDHGSFEARVTTADGAVTMKGSWKFTGGTGRFARLSGNGTYTGRMTSPREVETSWEGSYQLG